MSLIFFAYVNRVVTVCVAVVLLLSGCGGGGTSSDESNQEQVQPGLTLSFEDMGSLTSTTDLIRQLVTSTYDMADIVLQVGAVEAKVVADASRTIPGWGIGGYTLGPNTIELVIDPAFPNLEQVISDRLPYIVAHELHHAVRWRSVGVYTTLLQALVFEGMADDFAVEILSATQPPWLGAFEEDVAAVYFDRALVELDQSFDFEAWFFGLNTDLPQWTGYTLGYLTIQRYRLINPQVDLAELSAIPANNFRSVIEDAM